MHTLTLNGVTEDVVLELKESIEKLIGGQVSVIQGSGFNGLEDIVLFFTTIGTMNVLEPLSNIIVSWMERNKFKSIEIDNQRITVTGYSAKDAIKIMECIQNGSK